MATKLTAEEKSKKLAAIDELVAGGMSLKEACIKEGTIVQTCSRWRKELSGAVSTGKGAAKPKDFQRENSRLRDLAIDVLLGNIALKDR